MGIINSIKILLLSVLIGAMLSGCSTMKRPVSETDISKISKIAIVSALGNNFHNIAIGTTVFGNESFTEKVPDWKIDEFASKEASSLLANSHTTTIALQISGLNEIDSEAIHPDTATIIKSASEIALKNGYDTAVIIHKAGSSNYPQFTPGFGFYEQSFFGSSNRCAYGMYIISVVDTQSQKVIGWEWGGAKPCKYGSENDIQIKKSFNEYSVEEKGLIKKRVEANLKTSINYALTNLRLLRN